MGRPFCPCGFKVSKVMKLGPRPSTLINWHYYNFMPLTHLGLAQSAFPLRRFFQDTKNLFNKTGLGTWALTTVSTKGLYKISRTLKCVTWKAECLTKQKNGTFLIPEVPEQGNYFMRFLKWKETGVRRLYGVIFFFSCRLHLKSSSYPLLALHVPKTVSSPPKGLIFFT